MNSDAIAQVLLVSWMVALGCLMVRMLMLRLHQSHLLFVVSCGLDLIFGIVTVRVGLVSQAAASLGLIGDTMDVFLTPSVAAELFGPGGFISASPSRFLTPLILTTLSGLGIDLFLLSSPDTDSFQSASALAFIADTIVTFLVISYILRRRRQPGDTPERNTVWLRRLFATEVITSALRSIVAPFLPTTQLGIVDILFFGISLAATAACATALRKPPEATASA